jgi:predicted transcriptional regulator of viral defense system
LAIKPSNFIRKSLQNVQTSGIESVLAYPECWMRTHADPLQAGRGPVSAVQKGSQADEPRLRNWVDALPSEGRYTFSRCQAEAAAAGASFVAVQTALRRLRQKGRIVSPRRGFHVVVPAEYRAAGAPPASWFIDDLMRHLGRRYYVGLLSAAALHGAGHQQPMVFQVMADRAIRAMQVGRVRLEFHAIRSVATAAIVEVQTETGSMAVASPETTAFDLVRFPEASGYWSHIATVLAELADRLDPARLLEAAERCRPSDVQRLGFLLSRIEAEHLAEPLAGWLAARRTTAVRLRTDHSADGCEFDSRWRLIANDEVEPDL